MRKVAGHGWQTHVTLYIRGFQLDDQIGKRLCCLHPQGLLFCLVIYIYTSLFLSCWSVKCCNTVWGRSHLRWPFLIISLRFPWTKSNTSTRDTTVSASVNQPNPGHESEVHMHYYKFTLQSHTHVLNIAFRHTCPTPCRGLRARFPHVGWAKN